MWLGRQDLRQTVTRLRFLAAGLALLVAAELSSRAAIGVVVSRGGELKREEATFLFGTGSMPPLPPFLLSAAGTAVAVIAASVAIAERFPSNAAVRALVATGQLAFTWYVGHILIGLGGVTALGLTEDRPLAIGFATGAGFFAVAALLSLWCKRRFRHGPLEWLMRRVAG
jgi:uncharacterized membrane protein YeiB